MWRKEGGGRRRDGGAHGWGFTLAGPDDWKLHKFSHDAPIDNFKTNYGVDGTGKFSAILHIFSHNYIGDILKSENIRHFAELIRKATNGEMLDMVMGDGGVSVEGDENNQETKLKQLILCQFLMMFNILGKGTISICSCFGNLLIMVGFYRGEIYV